MFQSAAATFLNKAYEKGSVNAKVCNCQKTDKESCIPKVFLEWKVIIVNKGETTMCSVNWN